MDLAVRPLDLRPTVAGVFAPLAREPSGDGIRSSEGASFRRPRPTGAMNDTPATILVAEDDATTRTFLADELAADGCELLVADTAKDALRLI